MVNRLNISLREPIDLSYTNLDTNRLCTMCYQRFLDTLMILPAGNPTTEEVDCVGKGRGE